MLQNNELNILNNKQEIFRYNVKDDLNKNGFNAYIGKNKNNDNVQVDFTKTPHLLIGGSSGSGKSCLVNCILTSLLNKYDFNLCIIDIKQVEFLAYKNNKNLVTPIITSVSDAYNVLNNYIKVLNSRYNLLASKEYKSINEWNEKEEDKMHRHLIVIDELAHLLLNNKHIKGLLQQLLQLGRAVGIHLILATQAPNCKTIPTELKINVTARICLQVPTASNSKIIIDEKGGELLRGNGDGLIRIGNTIEHFQTALIKN